MEIDISKINEDIRKIERLVLNCDTEAFPLAILTASNIELIFSDKEIDLNSHNKLIGKLNSSAFHFHTNCSCSKK